MNVLPSKRVSVVFCNTASVENVPLKVRATISGLIGKLNSGTGFKSPLTGSELLSVAVAVVASANVTCSVPLRTKIFEQTVSGCGKFAGMQAVGPETS